MERNGLEDSGELASDINADLIDEQASIVAERNDVLDKEIKRLIPDQETEYERFVRERMEHRIQLEEDGRIYMIGRLVAFIPTEVIDYLSFSYINTDAFEFKDPQAEGKFFLYVSMKKDMMWDIIGPDLSFRELVQKDVYATLLRALVINRQRIEKSQ